MNAMPLPRLRPTTLLILVVLAIAASAAYAWVGRQREWIRQRHACLDRDKTALAMARLVPKAAPGFLGMFGEIGANAIRFDPQLHPSTSLDELRHLFPEAIIFYSVDGEPADHPALRPSDNPLGFLLCFAGGLFAII